MDSAKHSRDGNPAVILSAHGSAVEDASEVVRGLARRIQQGGSCTYVGASFPGPGRPLEDHPELASLALSCIRDVRKGAKASL